MDVDAAKEFVFAIDNTIIDVRLSQSGGESHEIGLVMTDSGASVNVCPKWLGESALQTPEGKSDSEARTGEHSKSTESDRCG